MIKKLTLKIHKFLCILSLITIFSAVNYKALAQVSPITLTWTGQVGCVTYDENGDPKDPREGVPFEEIGEDNCERFCENNTANYSLNGVPSGSSVNWSATGGNIIYISPNTYSCSVTWGNAGNGNLQVTITTNNSIVTKSLCIEKMITPTAQFAVNNIVTPPSEIDFLCSNQLLYFTNLSTNNNGTDIVSYLWDFGDGSTSTAENPTHTYLNEQSYFVTLTVYNSCNCPSVYEMFIDTNGKGFDITCPSVVCENQTEIYSLPFDGQEICKDNFNWIVSGGTIVSQGGGNIAITWDNVDSTGFGYVTFDPSGCELECSQPTTIKVPVILENGTISGNTSLCIGEQQSYSLPKWPTTEIEWTIVGDPNETTANIIQTDQRNEIVLTGLMSGTIVLRAVYKNTLLNCGGEAEITITIGGSAIILGEELVCKGTTSTFDFGNSSGVNVLFQLYNQNDTLLAAAAPSSNINYTFNLAGNYYLIASSDDICETRKNITVIDTPDGPDGITGVNEVCPDVPETFSVQNPQTNSTYIWYITNGTINGSNIGNSISATFNGTAPGELKVYKQTINPISCLSLEFAEKIITISKIKAEISNDGLPVCANTISGYQVNKFATSVLFTDPDVTYEWSLSNPLLGSISSGQGTNQIEVTWNNVQQATCDVKVLIKKCTIEANLITTVSINPIPQISIDTDNLIVCAGESISFDILSSFALPTTTVVTWNFTGTTETGVLNNQTHTFSNNTLIPVDYTITAQILEPNGCENTATNLATIQITVKPQPTATLSLISNANTFCNSFEINAQVEIASSTLGVTIVWYHKATNGVISQLASPPNNILQITGTQNGFGEYYFIATNADGCSKMSNKIIITQDCGNPPCFSVKPPKITNNSTYVPCGVINLVGTVTGTHISSSWVIYGPTSGILPANATTFSVVPGFYQVFHVVTYLCGGQPTQRTEKVEIVVPYEADFAYSASCISNTSFIVNFTDTSTFFNPIDNRQVNYFYASPTGSTNWLPLVATNNTLPQGTYDFKVVITGDYNGTTQNPCEKIIQGVALQSIGNLTIQYDPNPIPCHDTPVQFQVSNGFGVPSNLTYLWSFDNSAFVSSNPESITNAMNSPFRVFNTSGQHTVSVTVTNPNGCSKTLTDVIVTIPNKCFVGDISSSIIPAKACKYDANNMLNSITLSYDASQDAGCSGVTYQWMKGNAPFATTPTITVTENGLYWLKLSSSNNCKYECPTRIPVEFTNPPSIQIKGNSTFCEGNLELEAITQATNIQWFVDNNTTPVAAFNNLTTFNFSALSVGSHSIKVVVSDAITGCTNQAVHAVTVNAQPAEVNITIQSVTCNPYSVTLQASVPGNPSATFNWSNGYSGSSTTLTDGGPIKVTANVGGCTVSNQIFVPKNPESYLWVFPSGCFDACNHQLGTIVGPTLPFEHWSWNFDNHVIEEGFGDFVTPITLANSGSYGLTLDNGYCDATSDPLNYSTLECSSCRLEIREGIKITRDQNTPFCSYNFSFTMTSNWPFDYQATITSASNVVFSPSSFTILAGTNPYSFTVVPVNNFNGGPVVITIQGTYVDLETGEVTNCITEFEVVFPSCNSGRFQETKDSKEVFINKQNNISLYPNPTQDSVTLTYDLVEDNALLYVYDVTGRLMTEKNIDSKKGEINMDTSTYEAGIYIVVLKQNNKIINQQKLIKK